MKQKVFALAMLLLTVFSAQAQEKQYNIKSGILKTKTEAMGMTIEGTQYFDDYGRIIAQWQNQGGMEVMTVSDDQEVRMIIVGTGKGVKQKLPSKPVNYLALTDEMIDNYQIIQLDEQRTILGLPCVGYNMIIKQGEVEVEATTWVYEGVVLEMTQKVQGTEITAKAVSFEQNVPIDPKYVTVPDDIEYQEM